MKDYAMRIAIAVLCCTAVSAQAAVTISSKPTQNMNCASGVCTPTAKKAVLNVTDLTNLLASGNVTVNTGTGSLAQQVEDIIVASGFNWASASSLTLDAYRSVTVNQPVAVNGIGAVALMTNDGGSSGVLLFGSKGSLSFLATTNTLTINGTAYALENSIATLATAITANPSGAYALANSYDASQDGTYPASPIATSLTGTVQGLGNAISNLSVTATTRRDRNTGLFADVATTGMVANVHLHRLAFMVTSDRNRLVGGLVATNEGVLFADSAAGSIVAKVGDAGGLVGANNGTITSSSANVSADASITGGLAAGNGGTIALSQAAGPVKGYLAAGLVAINTPPGILSQCFATGRVKGHSVSTEVTVGGLVAENDEGEIENSYATGAVIGSSKSGDVDVFVGGLVGVNDTGLESTSYSTGAVSVSGGVPLVGGFVGNDAGSSTTDYWDTTTSGTDDGVDNGNEPNVTGLTSQQLQSGLPSGLDSTIWAENPNINNGFPYLIANPPPKK